ncbi:MAG: G8 domain-containing protein [Leptolyngbyaceae cyanobacterium]
MMSDMTGHSQHTDSHEHSHSSTLTHSAHPDGTENHSEHSAMMPDMTNGQHTDSPDHTNDSHNFPIHSAHPDDTGKQSEHSAVNSLITTRNATHVAVKDGSWFDASTWQDGQIPEDDAIVLIPQGTNVTYDGTSDARLFGLRVDGQLDFATDIDTQMIVDTFIVSAVGTLTIGTENDPVNSNVQTKILIADNGAIDTEWDPQQLSRGIVSHGTVKMHGQAKTSHLKVTTDPSVGDNLLILESAPDNWQVGDRIVLTGTRYIKNGTEDEERTVTAIDGNRIYLDRPLSYDHSTPRAELKAYVANQSRNIIIATENADTLPANQRGHVMFMHSDDVDVRYTEFRELGRTDKSKPLDDFLFKNDSKSNRILDDDGNPIPGARTNIRGRYPLHLHRTGVNGNESPATIVGNSVVGSPGWGIVHHDSYAILENNVSYDVFGSGFVSETGNEIGTWRNNISIKNLGRNETEKSGAGNHDLGFSGNGFWFQGRLVESEGNVAAGSSNAGIFYFHRGVDQIDIPADNLQVEAWAKGQTEVSPNIPVINGFKDNEVLASRNGLRIVKSFQRQWHDGRTVLDGFTAWEVVRGTELEYTAHYTLKDFSVFGTENSGSSRHHKGVHLSQNTEDIVIENLQAEGFEYGIALDKKIAGKEQLVEWGYVFVESQIENNKNAWLKFDPTVDQVLEYEDIQVGQLEFELDKANSDFVIDHSPDSALSIVGTKIDSLGSIALPFGTESLTYGLKEARNLIQNGYYTLPDGTYGVVIEEYISDRLTGEMRKYSFMATFENEAWINQAPYLGTLEPSQFDNYLNLIGTDLSEDPDSEDPTGDHDSPDEAGEEDSNSDEPIDDNPDDESEQEQPDSSGEPTEDEPDSSEESGEDPTDEESAEDESDSENPDTEEPADVSDGENTESENSAEESESPDDESSDEDSNEEPNENPTSEEPVEEEPTSEEPSDQEPNTEEDSDTEEPTDESEPGEEEDTESETPTHEDPSDSESPTENPDSPNEPSDEGSNSEEPIDDNPDDESEQEQPDSSEEPTSEEPTEDEPDPSEEPGEDPTDEESAESESGSENSDTEEPGEDPTDEESAESESGSENPDTEEPADESDGENTESEDSAEESESPDDESSDEGSNEESSGAPTSEEPVEEEPNDQEPNTEENSATDEPTDESEPGEEEDTESETPTHEEPSDSEPPAENPDSPNESGEEGSNSDEPIDDNPDDESEQEQPDSSEEPTSEEPTENEPDSSEEPGEDPTDEESAEDESGSENPDTEEPADESDGESTESENSAEESESPDDESSNEDSNEEPSEDPTSEEPAEEEPNDQEPNTEEDSDTDDPTDESEPGEEEDTESETPTHEEPSDSEPPAENPDSPNESGEEGSNSDESIDDNPADESDDEQSDSSEEPTEDPDAEEPTEDESGSDESTEEPEEPNSEENPDTEDPTDESEPNEENTEPENPTSEEPTENESGSDDPAENSEEPGNPAEEDPESENPTDNESGEEPSSDTDTDGEESDNEEHSEENSDTENPVDESAPDGSDSDSEEPVDEVSDSEDPSEGDGGSNPDAPSSGSGNNSSDSEDTNSAPSPNDSGTPLKYRFEAESLFLDGYSSKTQENDWVSAGKLVVLQGKNGRSGKASGVFDGEEGIYRVKVVYFDESDGKSDAAVTVAGEEYSFQFDELTSRAYFSDLNRIEKVTHEAISLQTGDTFELFGVKNLGERAAFDYVEFIRVDAESEEPVEPVEPVEPDEESDPTVEDGDSQSDSSTEQDPNSDGDTSVEDSSAEDSSSLGMELSGTKGGDTLEGSAGADIIDGGRGADTIFGGDGDDLILGSWGGDTIDGGAGNDTINAGPGGDLLTGGTGNDVFVLEQEKHAKTDTITDFEQGLDRLEVSAVISFGALDTNNDGFVDNTFLTRQGSWLLLDLSTSGGGKVLINNIDTLSNGDFV